jgi:hypothetical protein
MNPEIQLQIRLSGVKKNFPFWVYWQVAAEIPVGKLSGCLGRLLWPFGIGVT